MPSESWCGASYVARSMIVFGSKIMMSANIPSRSMPRSRIDSRSATADGHLPDGVLEREHAAPRARTARGFADRCRTRADAWRSWPWRDRTPRRRCRISSTAVRTCIATLESDATKITCLSRSSRARSGRSSASAQSFRHAVPMSGRRLPSYFFNESTSEPDDLDALRRGAESRGSPSRRGSVIISVLIRARVGGIAQALEQLAVGVRPGRNARRRGCSARDVRILIRRDVLPGGARRIDLRHHLVALGQFFDAAALRW